MTIPEDKILKPYLAGEFITTPQELEVTAPFNNEVIATTYLCDTSIIEKAIQAGLSVRQELLEMPSWRKSEALNQIADAIDNNKEYLAEVLAKEAAKPLKYALGEIDRAVQTFSIAAEETKRIHKEYMSLDWTPSGENKEGLVKYFPIGLVAGISPFNFPLNLAVHKIAPAIATGCPIILKPASSTPLSTLLLAKIIDKTDLPKGAVSILPADRSSGNMLVTDDRIKLLSFTGSDEVGWKMKKEANKKKVVLELGGNAGTIVTNNLNDKKMSFNKCFTGAFAYQGQVCIHSQRFWVHENILEEFISYLKNKASTLKYGAPEKSSTDISSMIDIENAIRVEKWVNEAISDGAQLIYGGKRNDNYYEPTILTDTRSSMKVECEEIFGPVITITPFRDFKQAVHELNEGKFGLQAAVFTDSMEEAQYAFNHIECGGVIINEPTTFRVDHMPYGGVKDSGLGREGIRYAMLDMLEPRIMVW